MKIGGILLVTLMLLTPLIVAGAVDYLSNITKIEHALWADETAETGWGYWHDILYKYYNASGGTAFFDVQSYSYDNETHVFTVLVDASSDEPSDSYDDELRIVVNFYAGNLTALNINKIRVVVEFAGNYTDLGYYIAFQKYSDGALHGYYLTGDANSHTEYVNGSKIIFEREISPLEALKIVNTVGEDASLCISLSTKANDNELLNNEVIQFSVEGLKSSMLFSYNDLRTWMLALMGIMGWLCAVVATKSVSIIPKRRRRR